MTSHLAAHAANLPHKCHCGVSFSEDHYLKIHQGWKHKEPSKERIAESSAGFDNEEDEDGNRSSAGTQPKLKSETKVLSTRSAESKSTIYKCSLHKCKEEFRTERELEAHRKSHFGKTSVRTNSRRFVEGAETQHQFSTQRRRRAKMECPICHFYYHRNAMPRHIKCHSSQLPFKCDICGLSFARKVVLTLHTAAFHRDGNAVSRLPNESVALAAFTPESLTNVAPTSEEVQKAACQLTPSARLKRQLQFGTVQGPISDYSRCMKCSKCSARVNTRWMKEHMDAHIDAETSGIDLAVKLQNEQSDAWAIVAPSVESEKKRRTSLNKIRLTLLNGVRQVVNVAASEAAPVISGSVIGCDVIDCEKETNMAAEVKESTESEVVDQGSGIEPSQQLLDNSHEGDADRDSKVDPASGPGSCDLSPDQVEPMHRPDQEEPVEVAPIYVEAAESDKSVLECLECGAFFDCAGAIEAHIVAEHNSPDQIE